MIVTEAVQFSPWRASSSFVCSAMKNVTECCGELSPGKHNKQRPNHELLETFVQLIRTADKLLMIRVCRGHLLEEATDATLSLSLQRLKLGSKSIQCSVEM